MLPAVRKNIRFPFAQVKKENKFPIFTDHKPGMLKQAAFLIVALLFSAALAAQYSKSDIRTEVVLYNKRQSFDRYLREKTIAAAFAEPLDSNSEYKYESACLAISQFQLQSAVVKKGLACMLAAYDSLQYSTRRALLEAVYAVYPGVFSSEINRLMIRETTPKLFAMQALYVYAGKQDMATLIALQGLLKERFPASDSIPLLQELKKYLVFHEAYTQQPLPPVKDLFTAQRALGQKVIYSFQRWNRDYPGLAIVQHADGSFARDSAGRLLVFRQLARAASNLPYFITNGNSPQGIFSIQGVAVSHNHLIGPTPNVQLVLPFEADSIYWHNGYDSSRTSLENYLQLLPESWRSYQPLTEAFYAGRIGRSEIIAHGTTINPEYYVGKPYYPLTPTQGCLCAREIWNESTGTLLNSDQLSLANTFLGTEGNSGYLIVINLDNQLKAVSRGEIEGFIE